MGSQHSTPLPTRIGRELVKYSVPNSRTVNIIAMDIEEDVAGPRCTDDVLTQISHIMDNEVQPNADVTAAPVKRHRNAICDIPEEHKKRIRKTLFADEDPVHTDGEELEELKIRPTLHRCVYGDEVLDLRRPLPGYEGASVILTNVYNTFMHIIRYKSTLLALKNRKLAIQLRTTEHHLRELENNKYDGAHVHLPRMVETLFSMLDHRNNTIYINQLKPVSCVLNRRSLMENISFRSMEATTKNDSNYIELMFNNPFRFIFVGCAKRVGPQNRNEVCPFPFFGDYINRAIEEMYEVMYDLVTKEIKKAKKELVEPNQPEEESKNASEESAAAAFPASGLQRMEAYSNSKNGHGANADTTRLHAFLRSIKMPLAKKEAVDILITSGNSGKKTTEVSKMCYLTVENDKENKEKNCLKLVDTDVTEDSIYLSSYIRCRVLILEQAKFGLQIYTRHAIQLLTIDDRLIKFNELFE